MRLNKYGFPSSFFLLTTLIALVIILQGEASATPESDVKCLIIVSGFDGYSQNELGKASSFYLYNEERSSPEDVVYLTDLSQVGSDGIANVTNIQNAFLWLSLISTSETEVTVYISDHAQSIFNETNFIFDDGDISTATIDVWLGQVSFSEMTIILNGKRSGLGEIALANPSRDIICSMGYNQEYDPDFFNITRSLEDPIADLNEDGKVDYIEAYWKEIEWLQGSGQNPGLYC